MYSVLSILLIEFHILRILCPFLACSMLSILLIEFNLEQAHKYGRQAWWLFRDFQFFWLNSRVMLSSGLSLLTTRLSILLIEFRGLVGWGRRNPWPTFNSSDWIQGCLPPSDPDGKGDNFQFFWLNSWEYGVMREWRGFSPSLSILLIEFNNSIPHWRRRLKVSFNSSDWILHKLEWQYKRKYNKLSILLIEF